VRNQSRRWSAHSSSVTLRVAIALGAVLALSNVAAAQGRGRAVGQGRVAAGSPTLSGTQTSTTSLVLQPSPAFPQYGTWLDDATILDAGVGIASVGSTYWRGSNANQINAPILSATYGVMNRAHISATVPFYRLTYSGYSGSGLENVYITAKLALVEPNGKERRFGIAVSGVTEILGGGFAESRAHWAAPISLEFRTGAARVYGSTGYFSRGAFFLTGAFEWTAAGGTSFAASLAHSQPVDGVTMSTPVIRNGALREANVFVSHPISNPASVYVTGSRTFSTTAIAGASSLGGGFSFRFGPK
jgi:hypothetical protein